MDVDRNMTKGKCGFIGPSGVGCGQIHFGSLKSPKIFMFVCLMQALKLCCRATRHDCAQ